MIEFLRECNHLTTEFKELEDEVFSSATFSLLKGILPGEYIEKMNDTSADITATAKLKTSALMEINSLKGFGNPRSDGDNWVEPKLYP